MYNPITITYPYNPIAAKHNTVAPESLMEVKPYPIISDIGDTSKHHKNSGVIANTNDFIVWAPQEPNWADIEALFGIWADRDDMDDDWLDNLRHKGKNRLNDLYNTDSDN